MKTYMPMIIAGFLLTTELAFAQPPKYAQRPGFSASRSKSAETAPSKTSLGLSLGAAEYPIVEMPLMADAETRVDGTTAADDVRVNRGTLMDVSLEWVSSTGPLPYILTFHGQRIATAPGAGIPTPASYARLTGSLATKFQFHEHGIYLMPSMEARRSMYRNVETGHYVDAILLQSEIGASLSDDIELVVLGGVAPLAKFGILQGGSSSNSGILPDTSTRLNELGTKLVWNASSSTDFMISASQENATVRVNNIDSYRAYGLPVGAEPDQASTKIYNLSVRQISVGARKRF